MVIFFEKVYAFVISLIKVGCLGKKMNFFTVIFFIHLYCFFLSFSICLIENFPSLVFWFAFYRIGPGLMTRVIILKVNMGWFCSFFRSFLNFDFFFHFHPLTFDLLGIDLGVLFLSLLFMGLSQSYVHDSRISGFT